MGGVVLIEKNCLIGMGMTIVLGRTKGKNTGVNNGSDIISEIRPDTDVKGLVGSVKS